MFAFLVTDWTPAEVAGFLGAIIPVIVAAATYVHAGSRVRAIIAAILAAISGPIATWLAGPGHALMSALSAKSAIVAWVAAVVTYLAGWQPVFQINAKVAPNVGIGKPKETH